MPEYTLKSHDYWMQQALLLAKQAATADEVPVGAIVVKNGVVIGKGRNRKEESQLATRHAEIEAIESASRNLGTWRLVDCDLYVTLEPCPMCAGAILQSRIRHLYFGADDPKGGAVTSLYQLLGDSRWNHSTGVTKNLLQDSCSKILSSFFRQKRQKSQMD